MSEETQTPQTEAPLEQETQDFDGHWNDVELMDRASQIAKQNFIDESQAAETAEATAKKKSFNKGVAVGVIAATAVGGVGAVAYSANQGPEFSATTTEYVVQPGDGLYNAAEDIKGINSIDIRDAVQHISVDPANIDALKNGLQPGETIVIPDSVQK